MGCLEELPGKSLQKEHAAELSFANLHLNKPQNIWSDLLWIDDAKLEMLGHNAKCQIW